MWRRVWLVAWREYVANVRTRTFIAAVLSVPAILALTTGAMSLLARQKVRAKPFAVIAEGAPDLAVALRAAFDADPKIRAKFAWQTPDPPLTDRGSADRLVAAGGLFAYVILPEDCVERGKATYAAQNLANLDLYRWLQEDLGRLIRERRFEREGVSAEAKERIMDEVTVLQRAIDERGAGRAASQFDLVRAFAPMLFVYLLFISVMTVAQMLLMNVIEEKSTRVIEVLLSSASAGELMAGKIAGVSATGLTMVGAWVLSLLAGVRWGMPILVPGLSPEVGAQVFDVAWSLLGARNVGFFALYGLLGFLFYGAVFAAIGSLFESVKDAQNLQTPVVVVLMIPVLSMTFITQNPHETLGRVLSWIPVFTPFVMMNRVAATPPASAGEVAGTLGLLLVSVIAAFWIAGRVFRVGVLLTGKPPTPREIWRILRNGG